MSTGKSAGATSSRKGAAASAVSGGVGILENESLAHQRFFVFERCAVEIQETFRVNEEACAEFFKDFVAVAGLRVQAHGIRQTRATATLHTDAQAALFGRDAFLFKELADFLRGSLA